MTPSPVLIDPAILYFGTPVALLSTVDREGTRNLAPMSSIFWLGHTAVLGMGSRSQTSMNMIETKEVVISLASVDQVDVVDRLALTSGVSAVADDKAAVGYRYVEDKFAHGGVTPAPSATVAPCRVSECPVSLEGRVIDVRPLVERDRGSIDSPSAFVFSVDICRVWVHPSIQDPSKPNRIDPLRWRPLIMSFQKLFGLGEQIAPSRLSTIDEEWYR
ncbi:flavin reductase family protein [Agreia sp. COWG]|uniref:flavin reductase family protein n=1 Tax=Agreia sp. COWG TaxID=2773266 RepID=UPI0019270AC8|nr:flavin reductase family protein [Agreia sp. COWG]CAD6011673.1 NADH-FMN oxidoreductase RutF, flavin reductase (DIM6/NTAB) family [Agreia sp. COWG]